MATHNPDNERIKRVYFTFLKEAKGHGDGSEEGHGAGDWGATNYCIPKHLVSARETG
jgi:hypothetical protein